MGGSVDRWRSLCEMSEQSDPCPRRRAAAATRAITSGRAHSGQLAGAGAVGQQRVADREHGRRPPSCHRHPLGRVLQPLQQPHGPLVRGRRSPSSRAPRRRSRSPAAWAPSAPWCSRCAAAATTSSPSASCTPPRSRSCRARAPASASRSPSSTAPSPARSPRPCGPVAR